MTSGTISGMGGDRQYFTGFAQGGCRLCR